MTKNKPSSIVLSLADHQLELNEGNMLAINKVSIQLYPDAALALLEQLDFSTIPASQSEAKNKIVEAIRGEKVRRLAERNWVALTTAHLITWLHVRGHKAAAEFLATLEGKIIACSVDDKHAGAIMYSTPGSPATIVVENIHTEPTVNLFRGDPKTPFTSNSLGTSSLPTMLVNIQALMSQFEPVDK